VVGILDGGVAVAKITIICTCGNRETFEDPKFKQDREIKGICSHCHRDRQEPEYRVGRVPDSYMK